MRPIWFYVGRICRSICCATLIIVLGASVASRAQQEQASQTQLTKDLKALKSEINTSQTQASRLAEQADHLLATESDLQDRLVQTARQNQDLEMQLIQSDQRLASLKQSELEKLAALNNRHDELKSTLAGLSRIARRSPQALLFSPGSTHDAIRSSIVLGAIIPVLTERAQSLERDLSALADLRTQIDREHQALQSTHETLATARIALDHLRQLAAAKRQHAEEERDRQAKRLTLLASEVQDIESLLVRLDTLRINMPQTAPRQNRPRPVINTQLSGTTQSASSAGDVSALASKMPRENDRQGRRNPSVTGLPVAGTFVTYFGETLKSGLKSSGLTIQVRPKSVVTASYDGHVAYADFFRNYGLLLIIEHPDGYHTLLSGMETLDVVVGQRVIAGEPVGRIGSETADLYIELRSGGQPVNPLPWFAALNGKVNG